MSVLLPGLDNRCRNVVSLFGTGNVMVGDLSSGVVVPGYKDAVLAFAEPQRFYYTLAPRDGAWEQWENGVGYLSAISDAMYLVRERVLTSSNNNELVNFAPVVGDLWASAPAELLRNCQLGHGNVLINGGFDLFQRQSPTTATARTDGQYGPDRWYVLTQTAGINCERDSGGTTSRYSVKLTQNQATAQRFGLAQVIEAANCRHLRGQDVIFQGVARPLTSQALRFAVVEWTGTADAPSRDFVSNWASGTYTAGNFFLGSNLAVVVVGSITPAAVTRTPFEVRGTVSNSCNNLYVFVWTEGTAAQNFTLELEECGLYLGTERRLWSPPPIADTIQLCQRYFEKSYDIDQVPGGSAITSGSIMHSVGMTSWANNAYLSGTYYKVPKLKVATVVFYSYNGTVNRISTIGGSDIAGAVTGHNHLSGYAAYNNSGSAIATTGGGFFWHHTAEAEL